MPPVRLPATVSNELPLSLTVRLPARTTGAEIECVPMSTVIEPAAVPKVNVPPLLPAESE